MLEYLNHEFGIERRRIVTSTNQRVTEEVPESLCVGFMCSQYLQGGNVNASPGLSF